jgi:hypothetical protein
LEEDARLSAGATSPTDYIYFSPTGRDRATRDLRKVSLWLGHASTQTTDVYLQADPVEKLAVCRGGGGSRAENGGSVHALGARTRRGSSNEFFDPVPPSPAVARRPGAQTGAGGSYSTAGPNFPRKSQWSSTRSSTRPIRSTSTSAGSACSGRPDRLNHPRPERAQAVTYRAMVDSGGPTRCFGQFIISYPKGQDVRDAQMASSSSCPMASMATGFVHLSLTLQSLQLYPWLTWPDWVCRS